MSLNSSTSSSSRYFLASFVLVTALLLTLGTGLALYLGNPDSDLMRIGRMASIDWRPAHVQPPLQLQANPPSSGKADLLVVGDSFSVGNAWQSELFRLAGKTALTWHYSDIGCIDDWLHAAIADHGTDASPIIVVETIEREFLARFAEPRANCQSAPAQMTYRVEAGILHDRYETPLFPIDSRYLLAAARHHLSTEAHHGRQKSRSAINVDLSTDTLFSHTRPARLSYYHRDDEKWRNWSPAHQQQAVDYLARMTALAAGANKRLLVLVIPDKSSTYAPWILPGQIPARPQPDLFKVLADTLGPDSNYVMTQ